MSKKIFKRYRKGAASIYVVVFTTMLLSVVTFSFMRVVLSENQQSTNNELFQSAYDSAIAGTEDAKIALFKYHNCLNQGFTANITKTSDRHECENLIRDMEELMNSESCDTISGVLKRPIDAKSGKVLIDTVTKIKDYVKKNNKAAKLLDQAYVCVKIKKNVNDYISTLDNDHQVRVVPLRLKNISEAKSISLRWHSTKRYDSKSKNPKKNAMKYQSPGTLGAHTSDDPFRPPTIKVEFFQADEAEGDDKRSSFSLGHFDVTHSNNRSNYGFVVLNPVKKDANISRENTLDIDNSVSLADSNNRALNFPYDIKCDESPSSDKPYMCNATIRLPLPYLGNRRAQGSTFLKVSLPYGDPTTEFNLRLCDDDKGKDCGKSDFGNIQVVVDATGRAGDLYRRVESRIELVDTNFPYPNFTIGSPASTFKKNFRITRNCWTDESDSCPNYLDLEGAGSDEQ